jgi:hypothetical protein
VLADLFLGPAAQQRDGHPAHDGHRVADDLLHPEDVAVLEQPDALADRQPGEVLQPLVPNPLVEHPGGDPEVDQAEHELLELRPVEPVELLQRHETVRAAVQRDEHRRATEAVPVVLHRAQLQAQCLLLRGEQLVRPLPQIQEDALHPAQGVGQVVERRFDDEAVPRRGREPVLHQGL